MKQELAKQEESVCSQTRYNKRQLQKSQTFQTQKDLVDALLDEQKTYTLEEATEIIERYWKGGGE